MSLQNKRAPAAVLAAGATLLALLVTLEPTKAQGRQGGAGAGAQPPPRTARTTAPIDLTGTWVSVISEEWRWRMLTPPKGDYSSIPLNDAARAAADMWNPDKDTAEGNACRAYGAVGIMALPIRLRISWQDDSTLKMEIDNGQQTRLFRFGDNLRPPASDAGWQGYSVARWQGPGGGEPRGGGPAPAGGVAPRAPTGGSLLVETTNMRPGYMRKNGVPYSGNARMTERLFVLPAPEGNQWLMLARTVQDSMYLNGDYVTSWHFKREANDAKFRPQPCTAS